MTVFENHNQVNHIKINLGPCIKIFSLVFSLFIIYQGEPPGRQHCPLLEHCLESPVWWQTSAALACQHGSRQHTVGHEWKLEFWAKFRHTWVFDLVICLLSLQMPVWLGTVFCIIQRETLQTEGGTGSEESAQFCLNQRSCTAELCCGKSVHRSTWFHYTILALGSGFLAAVTEFQVLASMRGEEIHSDLRSSGTQNWILTNPQSFPTDLHW